jgi:hypothetical protein
MEDNCVLDKRCRMLNWMFVKKWWLTIVSVFGFLLTLAISCNAQEAPKPLTFASCMAEVGAVLEKADAADRCERMIAAVEVAKVQAQAAAQPKPAPKLSKPCDEVGVLALTKELREKARKKNYRVSCDPDGSFELEQKEFKPSDGCCASSGYAVGYPATYGYYYGGPMVYAGAGSYVTPYNATASAWQQYGQGGHHGGDNRREDHGGSGVMGNTARVAVMQPPAPPPPQQQHNGSGAMGTAARAAGAMVGK